VSLRQLRLIRPSHVASEGRDCGTARASECLQASHRLSLPRQNARIMSNPGKVIQLTARPAETADLALESDGVVEARLAHLGDRVTAFDFAAFYAILGQTRAGSPGQLTFTSEGIRSYPSVASAALLTLRGESLKSVLDKAILARENAFYTKYEHATAIVAKAMSSYSPQVADSKPRLLGTLSTLARKRDNALQAAYLRDGRTGVIESTISQLTGHSASKGSSAATSSASGSSDSTSESGYAVGGPNLDDVGGIQTVPETGPQRATITGSATTTNSTSEVNSAGSADESQTVTTTGYDYRAPSLEAEAQYLRAQISLIDEQYQQFVDWQKLPNLTEMLANELKVIDLDVRLLQLAYLRTILLSPINGVVTGVFADPGDSVGAGDVLVRVENNKSVLLDATLVYRGRLTTGNTVTVQTELFSKPGNSVSITGAVVAARGDATDDRWNISVSCDNRVNTPIGPTAREILPLHYSFDPDNTSIAISP
jgi:multidrug efflux pump subunit AcrA (membrane-fusion protein)